MEENVNKGLNIFMKQEEEKLEESISPVKYEVTPIEEVITVPDCSYVNESQKRIQFYLCGCSEGYAPICEVCKDKCHKGHSCIKISTKGVCTCGKTGHHPKVNDTNNLYCIFHKFFEVTPNLGYVTDTRTPAYKTYCKICFDKCLNGNPPLVERKELDIADLKDLKDNNEEYYIVGKKDGQNDQNDQKVIVEIYTKTIEKIDPSKIKKNLYHRCECRGEHQPNVMQITSIMQGFSDFDVYIKNFNVNILFRIQKARQLFITSLLGQIKNYTLKKTPAQNFEFFTNYINFKILELFSGFSTFWKSKYISPMPFLFEYKLDDLLDLMSIPKNSPLPDVQMNNFYSSKLFFAELLYNVYIKSHLIKHNNLFTMKTILSMTVSQRYQYLTQAGKFYKIAETKKTLDEEEKRKNTTNSKGYTAIKDNQNKDSGNYSFLNKIPVRILELFSSIIKDSDKFQWSDISKAFACYNRIMKNVIKYNLISDKDKIQFFETLLDSLHLFMKAEKKDIKEKNNSSKEIEEASLSILKSLVYMGIQINDKKSYKYLVNSDINSKFFFQCSEINMKLCKIFLIILNQFKRGDNLEKTCSFDYCVKKFLELVIVRRDSFYYSIMKTNDIDKKIITEYFSRTHQYYDYVARNVLNNKSVLKDGNMENNKSMLEKRDMKEYGKGYYYFVFNHFCEEIGIINKKYFEYELALDSTEGSSMTYLAKANLNLQLLETSIKNEEKYYLSLPLTNKENVPKNLEQKKKEFKQDLKEVILHTNFIQKIDEFIYIYSKRYELEEERGIQNMTNSLEFILALLTDLCKDDFRTLILVMNIKPENFVKAFIYNKLSLFKFLNNAIDLMGKNAACIPFDGYYFHLGCIRHLIYLRGKELEFLPDIIDLAAKNVKIVMEKDSQYCNIVELFRNLFKELKEEKKFDSFNTDIKEKGIDNSNVFQSYFNFLSELIVNDLFLYNYIECEFNIRLIEECILDLLNATISFTPEFEFSIFRFYFLFKFSFYIHSNKIENQLKNLFDGYNDYSLIKLATGYTPYINSKEAEDKFSGPHQVEDKYKEIINTGKVLRQVLKKFVCERFNNFILNYYEHIILRPLYSFINYLVLYKERLVGEDLYLIYENVFLFYKVTKKIYDLESRNSLGRCCCKKELKNTNGYKVLEKEMHNFSITTEKEKDENHISYYEFHRVYQSFMEVVEQILLHRREAPKIEDEYLKTNILLEKYNNKKLKYSDDRLVFITSITKLAKETEAGSSYRNNIIDYLIMKLFDQLNENYIRTKYQQIQILKESDPKKMEKFFPKLGAYIQGKAPLKKSGKYHNSYALYFLNKLFYNDSKEFQEQIIEFFEKSKEKQEDIAHQENQFQSIKDLESIIEDPFQRFNKDQSGSEEKNLMRSTAVCGFFQNRKMNNACDMNLNKLDIKRKNSFNKSRLSQSGMRESNRKKVSDNRVAFLSYIIKELVFTPILAEVTRRYTIDYVSDEIESIGRNPNQTFQIGVYSLKFIQNLCEGHFQKFQTYFFRLYFEVVKNDSGEDVVLTQADQSDKPKSFINFLLYCMSIIMDNLIPEDPLARILIESIPLKDTENLTKLYGSIRDLIIEMIQGMDMGANLKYLYDKTAGKNDDVSLNQVGLYPRNTELKNPNNKKINFQFMQSTIKTMKILSSSLIEESSKDMSESIYQKLSLYSKSKVTDFFHKIAYEIKYANFLIVNSIIPQNNVHIDIIEQLNHILRFDTLIKIASIILCKLYITVIEEKKEFDQVGLNYYPLDANKLDQLNKRFKSGDPKIYEDKDFKLAGQIFLFLTIMGEKYKQQNAIKILKLKNKKIERLSDGSQKNKERTKYETDVVRTEDATMQNETSTKEKNRIEENNKIITCKFFSGVIKKVEFNIQKDDDGEEKKKDKNIEKKNGPTLDLKTIYFIVNPKYYMISKSSIERFENRVDRTSHSSKLKGFFETIEEFLVELDHNSSSIVNFKKVIKVNFYVSLAINGILLGLLSGRGIQYGGALKSIVKIAVFGQITCNSMVSFWFFRSRYGFYASLEKKKLEKKGDEEKKKLTPFEYIDVYVIKSYLFNDEIALIHLLIVLGLLGILVPNFSLIFFIAMLLTVIDFVDTIKEIIYAFKSHFNQLMCMIGFLAILIFFYANLGFYFYIDEFTTEINGVPNNFCRTLLECTITYFSHGVRAGGGIGDFLQEKSYYSAIYYVRFVTDLVFYITIILLLLNMINGIIVSTFSDLREQTQSRTEDIEKKCFICNGSRSEFEKNKKDFDKHVHLEHNLRHYIMFFIKIKKINEKDLDADQSSIAECLKEKNIKCFPHSGKEDEDEDVVEEEEEEEEEGGDFE